MNVSVDQLVEAGKCRMRLVGTQLAVEPTLGSRIEALMLGLLVRGYRTGRLPGLSWMKNLYGRICEENKLPVKGRRASTRAVAGWHNLVGFHRWSEERFEELVAVQLPYSIPIGSSLLTGTVPVVLRSIRGVSLLRFGPPDRYPDLRALAEAVAISRLYPDTLRAVWCVTYKTPPENVASLARLDVPRARTILAGALGQLIGGVIFPSPGEHCVTCRTRSCLTLQT